MKLQNASLPALGRPADLSYYWHKHSSSPRICKKSLPFHNKEQYVGNDFDLSPAPFKIRNKMPDIRELKVLAQLLLIKCILCNVINIRAGVTTLGTQRNIIPRVLRLILQSFLPKQPCLSLFFSVTALSTNKWMHSSYRSHTPKFNLRFSCCMVQSCETWHSTWTSQFSEASIPGDKI